MKQDLQDLLDQRENQVSMDPMDLLEYVVLVAPKGLMALQVAEVLQGLRVLGDVMDHQGQVAPQDPLG